MLNRIIRKIYKKLKKNEWRKGNVTGNLKKKKKLWEKKVVKVNYYYIFFWRMWLLGANFACEIQTCIIINYV